MYTEVRHKDWNEEQDVHLNVTKIALIDVWILQRKNRGAVLNTNRWENLLGVVSARKH